MNVNPKHPVNPSPPHFHLGNQAEDLNRTFSKEGVQMAKKVLEKMPNITN